MRVWTVIGAISTLAFFVYAAWGFLVGNVRPQILLIGFFLSLSTAGVFAYDKAQAQKDSRRVSEGVLLLLSLFGGWPGGFLAMETIRHKTQKNRFLTAFWFCAILNFAALILLSQLQRSGFFATHVSFEHDGIRIYRR